MLIAYFRHSVDTGIATMMESFIQYADWRRYSLTIASTAKSTIPGNCANACKQGIHQFCSDSDTDILRYAWRELTALLIKNER